VIVQNLDLSLAYHKAITAGTSHVELTPYFTPQAEGKLEISNLRIRQTMSVIGYNDLSAFTQYMGSLKR
jgi:hypothetical protein